MNNVRFYKINTDLPIFNRRLHEGAFVLDGNNNFWMGTDTAWKQISYQENVDKIEDDYYSIYYHKVYDFDSSDLGGFSCSSGIKDSSLGLYKINSNGTVTIDVPRNGKYRVCVNLSSKEGITGVITTNRGDSYDIINEIPQSIIMEFSNVDVIKFTPNIPIWVSSIIVQEEPSPIKRVSELENDKNFINAVVSNEVLIYNT